MRIVGDSSQNWIGSSPGDPRLGSILSLRISDPPAMAQLVPAADFTEQEKLESLQTFSHAEAAVCEDHLKKSQWQYERAALALYASQKAQRAAKAEEKRAKLRQRERARLLREREPAPDDPSEGGVVWVDLKGVDIPEALRQGRGGGVYCVLRFDGQAARSKAAEAAGGE